MEQLINLETASSILNVSKQTLRRWDESGKLLRSVMIMAIAIIATLIS